MTGPGMNHRRRKRPGGVRFDFQEPNSVNGNPPPGASGTGLYYGPAYEPAPTLPPDPFDPSAPPRSKGPAARLAPPRPQSPVSLAPDAYPTTGSVPTQAALPAPAPARTPPPAPPQPPIATAPPLAPPPGPPFLPQPAEPVDAGRKRRWARKPKTDTEPGPYVSTPNEFTSPDVQYVQAEFDVPAAGKPLTNKNGRRWIVRLALIIAPCILIGGAGVLAGVSLGSSRVPADKTISPADATKYGLTDFPIEQAAAFGLQYLQQCLSHPDGDDKKATSERNDALAAMSGSSGLATGCGWDGKGPATHAPSLVFTGTWSPMNDVVFKSGRGAYLTYAATLAGGQTIGYAVPVWVAAENGTGMRVAGDIAVVPATGTPNIPTSEPTGSNDSTLAGELGNATLSPFFAAWAASDTVQLKLVTTTDATPRAMLGLDAAVKQPQIGTVSAYNDKGNNPGGTVVYHDGDEIIAVAQVTWTLPGGGTQITGYRLVLRLVSSKWLVVDVDGSTANGDGGQTSNENTQPSGSSESPGSGSESPAPSPGG